MRRFIQFHFVPTASRVSRSANARRKIDRRHRMPLVSPEENISINPFNTRDEKKINVDKYNIYNIISNIGTKKKKQI